MFCEELLNASYGQDTGLDIVANHSFKASYFFFRFTFSKTHTNLTFAQSLRLLWALRMATGFLSSYHWKVKPHPSPFGSGLVLRLALPTRMWQKKYRRTLSSRSTGLQFSRGREPRAPGPMACQLPKT